MFFDEKWHQTSVCLYVLRFSQVLHRKMITVSSEINSEDLDIVAEIRTLSLESLNGVETM